MVGHVEDELQTIGRSIHAAFPTRQRHPLRALDTKAMELAAQDQELRAALFRLVDVTPACTSLDDLARHLTAFLDEVDERPPPIAAAMRMSQTRAGRAALGAAAAAGVRHMAHRFIVGETPRASLRSLRHLWEHGAAVSLDLLGEATVTQPEADRYAARCLDALETLAEATPAWPARPQLESDSLGPLPRVNVAVKVSALTPLLRPEAPEVGRDDAARRMLPLLVRAKELGAHLHIDMESVDTLEATMRLVFDLLEQPELSDGPSTGIVLQAYLRESPEQLEQVLDWASATARQPPLLVRLVKGAYWDHEIVEARQHGWTPPVFEQKAESDRNFERLTRRLIEGWPHVRAGRSPRTTCARWPTRLRPAAPPGAPTATSSCRCCAGSATTWPRRSPTRECACASTVRWATWWLGWPIWCGGCWRTRPTSPSSASSSAASPLEELLAAP